MKDNAEYKGFLKGVKQILRADPKIVKAAMEQEKQERAEERKTGAKTRGRKAKTALIFLPFLMLATARAADKHPERKARDRYAAQFAAEIEHDWMGGNDVRHAARMPVPVHQSWGA